MSASWWFMVSYSAMLLASGVAAYLWRVRPERIRRTERQRRALLRCEPNVVAGYADPDDRMKTICRVVQWSCGDAVCRCGGTKQRGYLDEPE